MFSCLEHDKKYEAGFGLIVDIEICLILLSLTELFQILRKIKVYIVFEN